jgi:uncharacterized membrane protein (DUF106 family)
MSKNAMIITAVIGILIFSYIFWKRRQTAAAQIAALAATGSTATV